MDKDPNMTRVQSEFLAAVQSHGLVRVLERIDHWASQVATAKIKDYHGPDALPSEVGAWAAVELVRRAQTSPSSGSAGVRMLEQAEVEVLAKMAHHSPARFLLMEHLKEQEGARAGEKPVRATESTQR